jgi:alpha-D-glucose phosphate-specific phosphoglucomutase
MSEDIRSQIKFGTDGWRGVISDNFTFANVRIVAQATAEWINSKSLTGDHNEFKRVAIGYDARFLSDEYAQAFGCVLAANHIEVYISDTLVPTPTLSYGVVDLKCVAGIMITASHNPGKFNGIKIKTFQGGAAGKDITDKVEAQLGKTPVKTISFKEATASGKIKTFDFKTAYIEFMRNYLDFKKFKTANFKVITDVMHGSGARLMEKVIAGSKIKLSIMRDDVNPSFEGGKPEPVVEYLSGILNRVKKERFDLGLVLDGDADRIAAVAPGGEFIHPQKILGLLILHLARNRGRQGGVVKTICGTMLIDNIAKKLGLKLYETPVGFKYISDLMVTKPIIAGGEEAGGMGVQDYIPERDGTLAGLLLVEMMVYQKKNIKKIIDEMEKEFGRYYYLRSDLQLGERKLDLQEFKNIKELLGKKVVSMKDFDGVKLTCEDESWLMLRPSGTEPLVRAYSESKSIKRSKDLLKFGESLVK